MVSQAGLVILGLAMAGGLAAVVFRSADDGLDPAARLRAGPGVERPGGPVTGAPTRERVADRGPDRGVPTLRGRCVAAETGAPLAQATWDWRVLGGAGETLQRAGADLVLDLPSEPALLALRVAAPDRVPVRGRLPLRPDAGVDLGTLALRSGAEVRGVLRDAVGRPIAGATLQLVAGAPSHRTGPLVEVPPAAVVTGEDGAFRLAHPVPAGTYALALRDAPPLLTEPTIRIEAGALRKVLDLTCVATSPADQIRGRVLDSSGHTAAEVAVQATTPQGKGVRTSTLSRADGSFVLYRPPDLPREQAVLVSVSSFDGGEQHEPVRCGWGRADLDLVMRAAHRLRVEVVEAETGEPVRAFTLHCFPMTGARVGPRVVEAGHDGGIAWVSDLRPGPHLVVVRPRSAWAASCAPTLPIPVEVPAEGDGSLRVGLADLRTLEVVAVHADGTPVEGSTVELFALHGGGRLGGDTVVTELSAFFAHGGTRGRFAVRIATGRTDGQGSARLDWSLSGEPLTVRITGPHAAFQERVVFDRVGQTVRAVVERGSTLRGRLIPKALLGRVHHLSEGERGRLAFLRQHENAEEAERFWARRASGLVLVEDGGSGRRLPWRRTQRFPIDEDGGFAIVGIPAGNWSVLLQRRTPQGTFDEAARPLARLTFADGQVRDEEFDLTGLVEPAVVSGEVRHNGLPLRDAEVSVTWQRRDGGRVTAGSTRSNGAGSFRIPDLAPRHYRLQVRIGESTLPLGREFELPAGGQHAQAYDLRTSAVKLRLRDGKQPAALRKVELRGASGLRWRRRTDEAGRLLLPFVPPGTYHIVDSEAPAIVVKPGLLEQEFTREL